MDFEAVVKEVKTIASGTILISFVAPEEFKFKAGQFVTLMVTKEGKTKPRSYSILNPPSEKGKVDLCIKLVDDGWASEIFTKIKVGDVFPAKGPFGHFTFDEGPQENWFICTGTGVVPFYSMLKENLSKFPDKKFKLIWGLRYNEDKFFEEELEGWKENYDNFELIITITREEAKYTGRVQTHLGDNFEEKTFYICGLKELVLDTKALLEEKGVAKENVKFERYS